MSQKTIDSEAVARIKREVNNAYDIRAHAQISTLRAGIATLLDIIERRDREVFDLRSATMQACDAAFNVYRQQDDLHAIRAVANRILEPFTWEAVEAEGRKHATVLIVNAEARALAESIVKCVEDDDNEYENGHAAAALARLVLGHDS